MTTIIVTRDDHAPQSFTFDDQQPEITIGRRSSNHVCIPDLSVSGNHARIVTDNGQMVVEDLGSTNGTYVNGRLTQYCVLEDGDDIVLGKVQLSVSPQVVQQPPPTEESAEDTEDASLLAARMPLDQSDGQSGPIEHVTHSNVVPDTGEHSEPVEAHPEPATPSDNEALNGATTAIAESASLGAQHADELIQQSAPQTPGDVPGFMPADSEHSAERPGEPSEAPSVQHSAASTAVSGEDASPFDNKKAVIEIKNGARSGQVLPINKPVTTLGRPGIQIAAIMRKPNGYYLMHIESENDVERPSLNRDAIGDEPIMLHNGDQLKVAGIDVEFVLS